MATTFVEVLLQLRDQYGADTLSGGYIQTDEAGTTTPLATYQDLAGAVPNTNPVILDSAGMAVIRQTNGVAYKWRVYDADDNLLWTRDNITVGSAGDTEDVYTILVNFVGSPESGGFMGGDILVDDVQLPADLVGSKGWVQTAPAASYEISIQNNDVEIATATIDTDGLFTFATDANEAKALVYADRVTFVAPTPDTAADFIIKLVGTII